MAGALSDQAWAEICAAAGRTPRLLDHPALHDPALPEPRTEWFNPDARAELSAILFDYYPNMAYDRERVAATYRRARRMLRHLDALKALYPETAPPPGDTERELYYIKMLHRRALAQVDGCRALRRANRKRADSQREWLVSRLCGVWLDYFHGGKLTYKIPSRGGPAEGPLIDFMLAAMRQVMPPRDLPRDLGSAVNRERAERAGRAQLMFDWERRVLEHKT